MKNLKNLFGEPAVLLSVIGAAIALAVSFGLNVSNEQVGLIMAAVAAVLGVITAVTTANGTLSALLALVKAGVAVGVGFGLKLSADQTGTIIAFATVLLGLFNRTQNSPAVGGPGNDGHTDPAHAA